jgi:hypothetical protein
MLRKVCAALALTVPQFLLWPHSASPAGEVA